jgi:hypothetical protein
MRWVFVWFTLIVLLVSPSILSTNASHFGVGNAANKGCQCHAFSADTLILLEDLPQRFESNMTLNLTLSLESSIPMTEGQHNGGFRLEYIGEGSVEPLDLTLTQELDGYLTHTENGSFLREWTFEWTTPMDNSTVVEFRIYGNAVNGNNEPTGDGWSELTVKVPGVQSNEDFSLNTSQEIDLVDIAILVLGLLLLGYLLWSSFRSN